MEQEHRRVAPALSQLTCRHHWVLGIPAGPISEGICNMCGEFRNFKNYLENTRWEGDRPTDAASLEIPIKNFAALSRNEEE